jgi:hypothetical protein
MPDGSLKRLRVWENSLLSTEMRAEHRHIGIYAGCGVDEPTITARSAESEFAPDEDAPDGGHEGRSLSQAVGDGETPKPACPEARILRPPVTVPALPSFPPLCGGRSSLTPKSRQNIPLASRYDVGCERLNSSSTPVASVPEACLTGFSSTFTRHSELDKLRISFLSTRLIHQT